MPEDQLEQGLNERYAVTVEFLTADGRAKTYAVDAHIGHWETLQAEMDHPCAFLTLTMPGHGGVIIRKDRIVSIQAVPIAPTPTDGPAPGAVDAWNTALQASAPGIWEGAAREATGDTAQVAPNTGDEQELDMVEAALDAGAALAGGSNVAPVAGPVMRAAMGTDDGPITPEERAYDAKMHEDACGESIEEALGIDAKPTVLYEENPTKETLGAPTSQQRIDRAKNAATPKSFYEEAWQYVPD